MLWESIKSCVMHGLKMSFWVFCWAAFVRAAGGSQAFTEAGTSLAKMGGAYLFGGVTGGVICGVLAPLGPFWWGSMLVGAVAGIPVMWAIGVALCSTVDTQLAMCFFCSDRISPLPISR